MNTPSFPTPLERLQALGLELPASPKPQGWYIPVARTGHLVFVSGQLPLKEGRVAFQGRVVASENSGGGVGPGGVIGGVSLETAREAARLCLLNILAALEGNGVPLSSVVRVVKVTGFVQSADDFHDQPKVLNAASELLTDIFGDAGRHARAAVGVNALPLNATVEIEAVFEV
jgi:enamine deaminase RidA (YjgF/YER057c/UK114 family)